MPSLIDLRRRIGSIKNTQQITRAMKMVAAARLRRSQDKVLAARPYADELRRMVTNLSSRMGDRRHALLEEREEKKILLAIVTGDKGLCGSLGLIVKPWPVHGAQIRHPDLHGATRSPHTSIMEASR